MFTIAAGCVLALASFTPLTDAIPVGFDPKASAPIGANFLNVKANTQNTLGVPTLVITKLLQSNNVLVVGNASFQSKPAFFKCSKDAQSMDNEKKAFDLLKKAKDSLKAPKTAGSQFIAQPLHAFTSNGGYCTIYTYGGNTTLRDALSKASWADKAKYLPVIANQMLQGLAYMHRVGVAHNDIKPDNVLVQISGNNVMTTLIDYDLGLDIRVPVIHLNKPVVIKGMTMGFRAPEAQIPNAMVDASKSDSWSVGASIYNMLTGLTLGYDYDKQRAVWVSYMLAAGAPSANQARPAAPAKNMPVFPTSPNGQIERSLVTALSIMDTLLTKDPKMRPTPQALLDNQLTAGNMVTWSSGVLNKLRGVKQPINNPVPKRRL
ncbi:kinase-like domain-containing protein [Syncephalis fuscata]|nr:kinase-like domain-containing protein [Syncephalis fuscata]